MDITAGSRLPCYCTALGKAILAFLAKEEAKRIVDKLKFVPHSLFTITDKGTLLRELELTKQRGYARNEQELTLGLKTVAVPIFRDGHVEGAFGMSYPVGRVEGNDLEQVFVQKLKEISSKISF